MKNFDGLPKMTNAPEVPEMSEAPNFHEVSEKRKELNRALENLNTELPDSVLKAKISETFESSKNDLDAKAETFKISKFGGLKGAKETLKKQRGEYEKKVLKDQGVIDHEAIVTKYPDMARPQKVMLEIAVAKDVRMQTVFDILSPAVSLSFKKTLESVLKTVDSEIVKNKKELEQTDPVLLKQVELIKYKEDLAHSGHICITPSVENDLEAIGDRMLTGKPVFLHGPTGTGKTSLARYAATHFTGETPEMVFCSPQTKESNVWGKTGIRPVQGESGKSGAIETVEIYGPLAKAMIEGKSVIFDEFTALPKEQMVFIKGIFNAKVGDKINIVGNGIVEIKPGFQMMFTANLKSEKNPERQDLPPEIAREFEQNNIKVKYTPPGEAYDVMLARLLNSDGSLDMSFHDLNTTLPNLCKVMADIQESYTNETDKEVAKKAGAMNAGGKVHSLKKFVMTQGSIEAILSYWSVEQKTKKSNKSFSEFLDQRFKTALTFEEYPKEDRVLVAKILASRGFLLTLNADELGLPADIFNLNTIKSMRGDDAVKELQRESGDIKHLNLKEVAELDPFGVTAEKVRQQAEKFLGDEGKDEEKNGDAFSKSLRKKLNKISSKSRKEKIEKIGSIDLETKTKEFLDLYKKTGLELPPDFEESITDIWNRNSAEIQEAIEQNGFDDILLVPGNIPLSELADKMKMGNGYYTGSTFDAGGGFSRAKSENVDKPRLILVHKTQNLKDNPELAKTLNTKGQDVKLDQALTLEDYLVFQRKYFEETGKHLDEEGWTWLATKSGARLVYAFWYPSVGKLCVRANFLDFQNVHLGVRPSRSFF